MAVSEQSIIDKIESLKETAKIDNYVSKLPRSHITERIGVTLSKINGSLLRHVPKSIMTFEMAFSGVQKNYRAIDHIPDNFLVDPLFLAAVSRNGVALRKIPEDKRNQMICMTALINVDSTTELGSQLIREIPERELNENLCFIAIKKGGFKLEAIPMQYRTAMVCGAAAQNEVIDFTQVPNSVLTEAFVLSSMKPGDVTQLPQSVLTERIALASVGNCIAGMESSIKAKMVAHNFMHLPAELKTEAVVRTAIENAAELGRFIPVSMLTVDFVKTLDANCYSSIDVAITDKDGYNGLAFWHELLMDNKNNVKASKEMFRDQVLPSLEKHLSEAQTMPQVNIQQLNQILELAKRNDFDVAELSSRLETISPAGVEAQPDSFSLIELASNAEKEGLIDQHQLFMKKFKPKHRRTCKHDSDTDLTT